MAIGETEFKVDKETTIDEARRLIDQEIKKSEEAIRRLKTRRNELAPISQLPPEILSKIFGVIEAEQRRPIRSMAWVKFSHVSHLWRAIAINSPRLWTTIPFNNYSWAEEMLSRSKMADLTIAADLAYLSPGSRPMELMKSIFNQMTRVREIRLNDANFTILDALFNDSPRHAPRLDSFCISGYNSGIISSRQFMIPEDALSETEHLRQVEITRCNVNWDSSFLGGLVYLKVHDQSVESSTTQFFNALRRMPALETLDLASSLPAIPSDPTLSQNIVNLPLLRSLRLSSTCVEVTNVLNSMVLPSTVALKLECTVNSKNTELPDLFRPIAALYRNGERISFRSLSLTRSLNFMTKAWEKNAKSNFDTLPEPLFSLCLGLKYDPNAEHETALREIMRSLPLRNLTSFETDVTFSPKIWVKTFGSLPSLRWIRVRGGPASSFIKALMYKPKDYLASNSAFYRVSFPALRSLSIEDGDFGSEYRDSEPVSMDTLRDCLMERCERGAAIEELILDYCYYLDYEAVELLEEIVVDVIWDGIEQDHSEEEEDDDDEDRYDSDGNTIYSDSNYWY